MSEADIPLRQPTLNRLPSVAESERPTRTPEAAAARTSSAWSFTLLWQNAISFPAMLGVFLIGRVFYQARGFVVDPDLWWHVKVGQDLLATHHFPTTDPYSFTAAGQPWIAYEWLGDLLIGGVAKIGGLLGLDALLFVLASLVMLALYAYATLTSENSKAGFVVSGLLCSLAFASFNLRPQMLGYLFLVLLLIALERFRRGKETALWFVPLLFLLWVNVHGSFIIGLGALVVHLLSGLTSFQVGSFETSRWSARQRIRLETVLLLSLAVLPLTPYGTQVAVYPFDMAFSQPVNVANVLEWQAMPFNIAGGKLFLVVLIGFLIAQMALQLRLRLADAVLFFGGVAMSCMHVRFLLIFVPFVTPLAATVFAQWLPPYERRKDHFVLNALLMAAVGIAIVRYFPTESSVRKVAGETFPMGAVDYLRRHPVAGPMFNTYGFGGYLVGNLPEEPVFIDGRGDLYERAGIFAEYLEATHLKPAAFQVLRTHKIQLCLLEAKEPLAVVLAHDPDWEKRYGDGVSVLFVRAIPWPSQEAKIASPTRH